MSLADSIILDINGVPGSGKSLMCVAIAQAKVDAWRTELLNKNYVIESKHTSYNFNKLKQLAVDNYIKHLEVDELAAKTEKEIIEIVYAIKKTTCINPSNNLDNISTYNFYEVMHEYYNNKCTLFDNRFELEYFYNFYLINLRPMIISNMPIFDKFNNRYSTIADYDWFKQAQNKQILIEPYTILILDEIDKEWNSFTGEKKEIINAGIVYTLQMWRHMTLNRGVFIMAYQIDTSLLYQIRANAENKIRLVEHKKDTKSLLLYSLIDKVNSIILQLNIYIYRAYMFKRVKVKGMSAAKYDILKRKNITFHKLLFAKMINLNLKIMKYFNQFTVFKLFTKIENSSEKKPKKKTIKLNLYDIKLTYNNTFFFPEHLNKLVEQSNKLLDRVKFSSLNPNKQELKAVNSTAYNRFFNLTPPEPVKRTKK